MKVAIMQPYFLPYIGYFQLINAVDTFVVYDDIEYTKKGWVNRNRNVNNKKVQIITIPLKKDSDYLSINQRTVSTTFDKSKLLRQVKGTYQKVANFNQVFQLLENIVNYNSVNLFDYVFNSISLICNYLDIETPLVYSSSLNYDTTCKSEKKVLDICSKLNCDTYINPIGGRELYSVESFAEHKITLNFLKTSDFTYGQLMDDFEPNLSIIDVLMMNSKEKVQQLIESSYTLIQ